MLTFKAKAFNQGRNDVRWLPGQEAWLAPPCSNLRSFGSKCSVLKKVFVALLGLFGTPAVIRRPPQWFGARGIVPSCHPRCAPAFNTLAACSQAGMLRKRWWLVNLLSIKYPNNHSLHAGYVNYVLHKAAVANKLNHTDRRKELSLQYKFQ